MKIFGAKTWATISVAVMIFLLAGASIEFAWVDHAEDSNLTSRAQEWLAGVSAFLAEFYSRWEIQTLLAVCVIGLGLERIIPARPQPIANSAFNIPYSAIVLLFVGAIVPLQIYVAEALVGLLGWENIFNLKLESGGAIPAALAVMLIEALAIDFCFYWFHRCQHRIGILWQVHLLHHSDMALNVTTTHRVHIIEHLLTPFFIIVPLMILVGVPSRDIYWIAILPSLWSYFVHANLRIGFGRLWWLISSPQYHRIHHSLRPEHRDKNFAVWFPVFDIAFRTAYAPKRDEYPETGVEGVAVHTLSGAFMLPFERWRDMIVARRRDPSHGPADAASETEAKPAYSQPEPQRQ